MADNWQPQLSVSGINGGPIENGLDGVNGSEHETHREARKKVVVVGLGMVGISFMYVLSREVEQTLIGN